MCVCKRKEREWISTRQDVAKEIPKDSGKIDRQEKERPSIKTDSQHKEQTHKRHEFISSMETVEKLTETLGQ